MMTRLTKIRVVVHCWWRLWPMWCCGQLAIFQAPISHATSFPPNTAILMIVNINITINIINASEKTGHSLQQSLKAFIFYCWMKKKQPWAPSLLDLLSSSSDAFVTWVWPSCAAVSFVGNWPSGHCTFNSVGPIPPIQLVKPLSKLSNQITSCMRRGGGGGGLSPEVYIYLFLCLAWNSFAKQ